MKTKVIYKDDELSINIDLIAYYALAARQPTSLQLKTSEKVFVLGMIRQNLVKEGYIKEDTQIYSIADIPIIEVNALYASTEEPMSIFIPALNYLATYEKLDNPDDYEDIISEISDIYTQTKLEEGQYFYTAIFHKKIAGVKGYFAYITNGQVLVSLWDFSDTIIEDINPDDFCR